VVRGDPDLPRLFVVNLGAALGLGTVWKVEPGSGWAQVQEGVTDLVPILLVFAWVALFERRRISSLGFRRPSVVFSLCCWVWSSVWR
jgi:hypothetical protein